MLSLYLTSLLCSSGLVTRQWMFHASSVKANVDIFLAMRYHIAAPDDLDHTAMVRTLLQLSTYDIEILPLSNGKSIAVSGEIAWGSATQPILSAERGMRCCEDKQCTVCARLSAISEPSSSISK